MTGKAVFAIVCCLLLSPGPVLAASAPDAVPEAAAPASIGALGRVEPRGRVIRLSHDAGPNGARIEKLEVAEGQSVTAGQRLAVFSEYALKQAELYALEQRLPALVAELKAEAAQAVYSRAELDRANQLRREKAVSVSSQQQQERDAAQAAARVESLRAQIAQAEASVAVAREELTRTQLFSPIAGTILKIRAWPGERLGDAGLGDIADLTAMDVVAQVYERDMPRVRPGNHARIRVPGTDLAYDGEVRELGYQVMKNDLNDTDPLADRDNRVVEVRITLPPEAAEALRHLIYMQVDVRIHD